MHSTDRTLLANLGFNDPDKSDARHKLACQYLSDPETAKKLIEACCKSKQTPIDDYWSGRQRCGESLAVEHEFGEFITQFDAAGTPIAEQPLVKGQGQYKTTVGFIDLILPFTIITTYQIQKQTRINPTASWGEPSPHPQDPTRKPLQICIEVKIKEVGVDQIIRQINLYREYIDCLGWVAATNFDLTQLDVRQLNQAQIKHIRLGPSFQEFCRKEESTEIAKSLEI